MTNIKMGVYFRGLFSYLKLCGAPIVDNYFLNPGPDLIPLLSSVFK